VEWVEEGLDECVGIVTLQLVLAGLPRAIIPDIGTPLWVVEEEIGRSPEILLAMGVVALGPVVDRRVADRAERRFVAVEHELVVGQHSFQVLQVVCEAVFIHEGSDQRAAFGAYNSKHRSERGLVAITYRMEGGSTSAQAH